MSQNVLLPTNSIQIIRGTSKTVQLTVVDSAGNPVDLTNGQAFLSVKRYVEDPAPLIQKSTRVPAQSVITSPRSGIVQFYFNPIDTQTLDPIQYVFDAWVILSTNARYAVLPPSIFEVVAGVTVIPP